MEHYIAFNDYEKYDIFVENGIINKMCGESVIDLNTLIEPFGYEAEDFCIDNINIDFQVFKNKYSSEFPFFYNSDEEAKIKENFLNKITNKIEIDKLREKFIEEFDIYDLQYTYELIKKIESKFDEFGENETVTTKVAFLITDAFKNKTLEQNIDNISEYDLNYIYYSLPGWFNVYDYGSYKLLYTIDNDLCNKNE